MKRQRDDEAMTESLDVANCLMLLSQAPESKPQITSLAGELQVFECKSCNRKFSSFQALGGHRASHNKRPKLEEKELKVQPKPLNLGNKHKIYHCSICGLGFSQGQALGGHMRKHRVAIEEDFQPINQLVAEIRVLKSSSARLDLNLTPLENEFKLLFAKIAPNLHLSLL